MALKLEINYVAHVFINSLKNTFFFLFNEISENITLRIIIISVKGRCSIAEVTSKAFKLTEIQFKINNI